MTVILLMSLSTFLLVMCSVVKSLRKTANVEVVKARLWAVVVEPDEVRHCAIVVELFALTCRHHLGVR